jgi:hypothetical protein
MLSVISDFLGDWIYNGHRGRDPVGDILMLVVAFFVGWHGISSREVYTWEKRTLSKSYPCNDHISATEIRLN